MSKDDEIVYLPNEGFVRSKTNPKAIINVDNEALKAYKLQREAAKQKNNEINRLSNELNEVKQLLYKLLSEKNK